MKRIFQIALALSLLSGTAVMAQPDVRGRDQQQNDQSRNNQSRNNQMRGNQVPSNQAPTNQGRNNQMRNNDQARGNQAANNQGRNDQGGNGQDRYEAYRNDPGVRMSTPRFSRGDHVPDQYRNDQQYVVTDWQQRNLRKPPRGYHWVRDDNNNYFLAAVTTGVILDLLLNNR